ncbi:alanine racemase [Microbacterium sp. YY-01]|uniref:alanine racemase n=1 Tax=Microbacterium sp. YY-01 TaxID=3421634 RepID=UPI003D1769E8
MTTLTTTRQALIDLAAVDHNVRHIAATTGVPVIAVVKANGYGHGAFAVAETAVAAGAARIGVATIDEAVYLRQQGLRAPLMAWLHGPSQRFDQVIDLDIEVGVSSFEQLQSVAEASRNRAAGATPTGIHLKLDTGLSRNGIAPADWERAFAETARLVDAGHLRIIGIFTHLSGTSVNDDTQQLHRMLDACALAESLGLHPKIRHIAATAAALSLPEARLDAVRIGIGLYGLSPFDDYTSADLGLRPAMTLRAQVAAVRRVPAGAGISYGFDYRTDRETTLALIPLGYADGVPRQASGRGPVTINGRTFTVAGRIAMDQFVVDVGEHTVAVGDTATLFGDPARGVPSATDWADAAGTINYEIVTRIGARVPRVIGGDH